MFPSNGVITRHPLRSTGSLGMVPPLRRYYGMLRLPTARLAALRCLRLAIPPCASWFAPGDRDAQSWASGSWSSRFPSRLLRWKRSGLPGSRRTLMVIGPVLRPRRDRACGVGRLVACPARPPFLTRTKAPAMIFRGSIARPLTSLSTLRSDGRPSPRKTRFRRRTQLCRTGLTTRRVPAKGFEL